jgi:hypothetical protein
MKFIEEFDGGTAFPTQCAAAVMIMGDGAPFILVLFKIMDEKILKGQIPPFWSNRYELW